MLDRETGNRSFPWRNGPCPRSDVPGERSWPTQPFPTAPPPLVPQRLTEADLHAPTPEHLAACRELLAKLRNEGLFTPPSEAGSIVYPFSGGGANWSGAAWDAHRQRLFVPVQNLVNVIRLDRVADRATGGGKNVWPLRGVSLRNIWWLLTGRGTGERYRLSPLSGRTCFEHDGVPCNRPPWGLLVGVDLARGTIAWSASTSAATATPAGRAYGPALATASGLVFHAGTERPVLRVHDAATGERIASFDAAGWAPRGTDQLQAAARRKAVPGGRAGRPRRIGSPLGDYVIAYTLPDSAPSSSTAQRSSSPRPTGAREQPGHQCSGAG